ncbi:MAG TPA: M1 family aminopeptidase [Thermoanaerobaculia bacterium]|nr:M1 family aminopeptidase [Thermoanaerobaculia bacterium]
MLKAIFEFEIRYHLRQWLFWLVTPVFLLLCFGAVSSEAVQIGGGVGNVHRNSPYVIMQFLTTMTVLGMFVMTAFVASSVQRDFEHNTHALFFSKPIRKSDYLIGRFAGSLVVSVLIFVGCALGIVLGSIMPWVDPEQIGAFQFGPYIYAFLVFVIPNLVFMGGILFSLASFSRNLLTTYVGVVLLFVLLSISGTMTADLENRQLASLLDPFGSESLSIATQYWTVDEKNNDLPPVDGWLLVNRLVWTGVGLGIFALSFVAFDPSRSERRAQRRRRKRLAADAASGAVEAVAPLTLPRFQLAFSSASHWRQFLLQARIEAAGVIKGVLFLIMLLLGVVFVVLNWQFRDQIYGTSTYPVTRVMLDIFQGNFYLFLIIVVIFYSGELIWKERAVRLNEVYDALPVPSWVPLASKLMALWAVVTLFLGAGILSTIGIQLFSGYTRLEPGLYLTGLLSSLVPFLLISVLTIFFQVASNSKFLGYLLSMLWMISSIVLAALDFDHNLYRYAGRPSMPLSDMNGYGHFITPFLWFTFYWGLFALVLFGLSMLFRVRGTEASWKTRWKQARERFTGPARAMIVLGLLGFVAVGSFIFYNTNILNRYTPGDEQEKQTAEYEKRYRQYKDVDMPRITAVRTDVDIFPRERRVEARGHYRMKNKTARPIDKIYLNVNPEVKTKLIFRPHSLEKRDDQLGFLIYRLQQPLRPGEEMDFDFTVEVTHPGFVNSGSDTGVVYNGSFFSNGAYFPSLGYQAGRQLQDRGKRRKYGLQPVDRMPKVDDLFARRNNYLTADADWIDFETTVSTSPDQIAIAPGYLQREWVKDGRRYFHYKMDSPILHFYSYLSADYQVKRDSYKGVNIEIYYHAPHTYNLDRMIDSIKKSLDYYTANFSPYQHRQVRIIEFPAYATFAQSFPNTIPYSEGIGFIANLKNEDAIDYVFYITAHEVAHQWWAHQVIGGNVQGATMLSETMSQYSALMVMEREYGKEKMRRFLKYELDNYLRNRGSEVVEELPLMLVENQQYIHYRKGSVVLYALQDYIGQQRLNPALSRYIKAVAFQNPPYTNTVEYMKYVEAATPPELRYVLDDMFRKITLFENRVTDATYTRRADGKYDVNLTFEAKKVRSDGKGKETPVPINDWIDVGVFGEKAVAGKSKPEETVLYLQKRHITQPRTTVQLVVDQLPVRAGIDPMNKLVDRNSDDNRKKVTEGAAAGTAGK